jgi:UDP-glucose 4-epimerase
MTIFITGGLGYIGSHTATVLIQLGYQVILYDNLSNSELSTLYRLEVITNKKIKFIEGDVRNINLLSEAFTDNQINSVIHFAGLKSVKDSFEKPTEYYDNNVTGTINLLKAMKKNNINKLVFSSSATVYGEPIYLPYDENHSTIPVNPYGRSKLIVEEMLKDLAISDPDWSIAALRYFNPVGAHESGLIGEMPKGIPSNLMPYLVRVASKKLKKLEIFGGDYDTRDGTAERDYIHVMDLAEGHLAALVFLEKCHGWHSINLGTGQSTTVLEMIHNFQKINQIKIPYEIVARRSGDIAKSIAAINKASEILGWKSCRTLDSACESAWQYEQGLLK